ncbi:MAG: M23 family metallopeptidase [Candidatus Kapabacteria bacterium]|nr:M23 family metallopeptidase [Candidatus Kapabacteria bacterium]
MFVVLQLSSDFRKKINLLLFLLTFTFVLSGCGSSVVPKESSMNSVSLPKVATFSFPDSAFKKESVVIKKTSDTAVAETFEQTAFIYDVIISSSYEVRINIGKSLPLGIDEYDLTLNIPSSLNPTGDKRIMAFAIIDEQSDNDELIEFETIHTDFKLGDSVIHAKLPWAAYINKFTSDGTYEAVIKIAITEPPIIQKAQSKSNNIQFNEYIDPPLLGALTITCPIQKLRSFDSKGGLTWPRDKNGNQTFQAHKGTDFHAAIGEPVEAIDEGLAMIFPKPNSKQKAGDLKFVVIKHPNGTKSRYLHLDRFQTYDSAIVSKGQTIGFSGNSGNVAAHLHVEYYVGDQETIASMKDIVKDLVHIYYKQDENNPVVNQKYPSFNAYAVDKYNQQVFVSKPDSWQWRWDWSVVDKDKLMVEAPCYTKGDDPSHVNLTGLKEGPAKINIKLSIESVNAGRGMLSLNDYQVDTTATVDVAPDWNKKIDSGLIVTGLDSLVNSNEELKKLAHSGKGFYIFNISSKSGMCELRECISGELNQYTNKLVKTYGPTSYDLTFGARLKPEDKCSGGSFMGSGNDGAISENSTKYSETNSVTGSCGLFMEGYGGSYYTPWSTSSSFGYFSFMPKR